MKKLFSRKKGQGLVEYALILVLIAIIVVVILRLLGGQVNLVFARIMFSLEHPGDLGGNLVTASIGNITTSCVGVGGQCDHLDVSVPVTLAGDVTGNPNVYVIVTHSDGTSATGYSSSPVTVRLDNVPAGGSVQVCVLGVQNHSLSSTTCR